MSNVTDFIRNQSPDFLVKWHIFEHSKKNSDPDYCQLAFLWGLQKGRVLHYSIKWLSLVLKAKPSSGVAPSLFNIWSTFKIWIWTSGSRAPKDFKGIILCYSIKWFSHQFSEISSSGVSPSLFNILPKFQFSSRIKPMNQLTSLGAHQKFQGVHLLFSIKWLSLVFER